MKLCLPLGVSAVEFSATAGEQIKVAALNGSNHCDSCRERRKQVDKYLTADLSKHPKRTDKWIAEAVKIASQASDPHIELEAVLAHCDGIAKGRDCDTRNVFDRLAVAEAGVVDLSSQVEYWRKAAEEKRCLIVGNVQDHAANCAHFTAPPAANSLVDAITESVDKVVGDGRQTESL